MPKTEFDHPRTDSSTTQSRTAVGTTITDEMLYELLHGRGSEPPLRGPQGPIPPKPQEKNNKQNNTHKQQIKFEDTYYARKFCKK